MLLAVDIGNTNILFGFFDSNGTILKTFRIETRRARTFDEYYAIYNSLTFDFFQQDGKFDAVEKIIFSSVVSEVNFEFCKFCKHYLKLKPIDISNHKSSIGVSVLIDNPEELGGDRLVNAYSAFKQYGGNNIVIDFGTATTFDIINSKAEYLGGVIAPGINLSLQALQNSASKLPKIEIEKPDAIIGKNTVSAMNSGIYYGYIGLIKNISSGIKQQKNEEFKLIATGGLAKLFAEDIKFDYIDDDLTLRGLYLISNKIEN